MKIDIKVGDVLLYGQFKNRRMVVKEIGTDVNGQPTVNGKKLLNFRLEKKLPDDLKSKQTRESIEKKAGYPGTLELFNEYTNQNKGNTLLGGRLNFPKPHNLPFKYSGRSALLDAKKKGVEKLKTAEENMQNINKILKDPRMRASDPNIKEKYRIAMEKAKAALRNARMDVHLNRTEREEYLKDKGYNLVDESEGRKFAEQLKKHVSPDKIKGGVAINSPLDYFGPGYNAINKQVFLHPSNYQTNLHETTHILDPKIAERNALSIADITKAELPAMIMEKTVGNQASLEKQLENLGDKRGRTYLRLLRKHLPQATGEVGQDINQIKQFVNKYYGKGEFNTKLNQWLKHIGVREDDLVEPMPKNPYGKKVLEKKASPRTTLELELENKDPSQTHISDKEVRKQMVADLIKKHPNLLNITADPSLDRTGIEVKISHKNTASTRRLLKKLKDMGYGTSFRTGLHIHSDFSDIPPEKVFKMLHDNPEGFTAGGGLYPNAYSNTMTPAFKEDLKKLIDAGDYSEEVVSAFLDRHKNIGWGYKDLYSRPQRHTAVNILPYLTKLYKKPEKERGGGYGSVEFRGGYDDRLSFKTHPINITRVLKAIKTVQDIRNNSGIDKTKQLNKQAAEPTQIDKAIKILKTKFPDYFKKSPYAESLLRETANVESQAGKLKHPDPNYMGGMFQVDKGTFDDIKSAGPAKYPRLAKSLKGKFDLSKMKWSHLANNPHLSGLFALAKYRTVEDPIPATKAGRAAYWKKYYNSYHPNAKGTPEHYLEMNNLISDK